MTKWNLQLLERQARVPRSLCQEVDRITGRTKRVANFPLDVIHIENDTTASVIPTAWHQDGIDEKQRKDELLRVKVGDKPEPVRPHLKKTLGPAFDLGNFKNLPRIIVVAVKEHQETPPIASEGLKIGNEKIERAGIGRKKKILFRHLIDKKIGLGNDHHERSP